MQKWKRAVVAGSAGAAVALFLKRKPEAGVILTGIGLATLASEYPERFEELRERLPEYIERGTSYLDAVTRLGARLAMAAERSSAGLIEELLEG